MCIARRWWLIAVFRDADFASAGWWSPRTPSTTARTRWTTWRWTRATRRARWGGGTLTRRRSTATTCRARRPCPSEYPRPPLRASCRPPPALPSSLPLPSPTSPPPTPSSCPAVAHALFWVCAKFRLELRCSIQLAIAQYLSFQCSWFLWPKFEFKLSLVFTTSVVQYKSKTVLIESLIRE